MPFNLLVSLLRPPTACQSCLAPPPVFSTPPPEEHAVAPSTKRNTLSAPEPVPRCITKPPLINVEWNDAFSGLVLLVGMSHACMQGLATDLIPPPRGYPSESQNGEQLPCAAGDRWCAGLPATRLHTCVLVRLRSRLHTICHTSVLVRLRSRLHGHGPQVSCKCDMQRCLGCQVPVVTVHRTMRLGTPGPDPSRPPRAFAMHQLGGAGLGHDRDCNRATYGSVCTGRSLPGVAHPQHTGYLKA